MIKILVNGKQNPLGINFGKIRLDLKTELEYTPKQITFNLYNDLDSAKNNQPFFTQTTDKYSISANTLKKIALKNNCSIISLYSMKVNSY